eukprot:12700711-Prorocentrum_lima.AAC.1
MMIDLDDSLRKRKGQEILSSGCNKKKQTAASCCDEASLHSCPCLEHYQRFFDELLRAISDHSLVRAQRVMEEYCAADVVMQSTYWSRGAVPPA